MKTYSPEEIEKVLNALRKNHMQAHYVATSEEALELVRTLLPKGATVSHGGSVTLKQIGVTELLKNGEYDYLDRSA